MNCKIFIHCCVFKIFLKCNIKQSVAQEIWIHIVCRKYLVKELNYHSCTSIFLFHSMQTCIPQGLLFFFCLLNLKILLALHCIWNKCFSYLQSMIQVSKQNYLSIFWIVKYVKCFSVKLNVYILHKSVCLNPC